jgi:PBP1b-binding outer membrane lipoprotein LpoB
MSIILALLLVGCTQVEPMPTKQEHVIEIKQEQTDLTQLSYDRIKK